MVFSCVGDRGFPRRITYVFDVLLCANMVNNAINCECAAIIVWLLMVYLSRRLLWRQRQTHSPIFSKTPGSLERHTALSKSLYYCAGIPSVLIMLFKLFITIVKVYDCTYMMWVRSRRRDGSSFFFSLAMWNVSLTAICCLHWRLVCICQVVCLEYYSVESFTNIVSLLLFLWFAEVSMCLIVKCADLPFELSQRNFAEGMPVIKKYLFCVLRSSWM